MAIGLPSGVYASTERLSMKIYESKAVTSSTGVRKTTTTYSNGSCTEISGANNYCHISLWLVDEYGSPATDTEYYSSPNETNTLEYKSGYGRITYKYFAKARIVTGSATTSTTLSYRLTP